MISLYQTILIFDVACDGLILNLSIDIGFNIGVTNPSFELRNRWIKNFLWAIMMYGHG